MRSPADDRTLLTNLEFIVERAQKDVTEAKDRLSTFQERLGHGEALLAAEKERAGQLAPALTSRFEGMSFGEAAQHVVQEANGQEISADAIWDILSRNGFSLISRQPGRAIHAAFINAEDIERTGRARYRTRRTSITVN